MQKQNGSHAAGSTAYLRLPESDAASFFALVATRPSAAMSRPFTIQCCDGWCDITDHAEVADPPWTLAKPHGVGAFQFSIGRYKSGRIPNPSPQLLHSMLGDFASSHKLGEPADIVTEEGELRIAAASFQNGDDFIRVWYASDGRSFAKVTYTCAWDERQAELPDCERMIRTLRFED